MGLMNVLVNYGKGRMMANVLRRGMGGPLGTALFAAWAGKKAWDYMQHRKRTRLATSPNYRRVSTV